MLIILDTSMNRQLFTDVLKQISSTIDQFKAFLHHSACMKVIYRRMTTTGKSAFVNDRTISIISAHYFVECQERSNPFFSSFSPYKRTRFLIRSYFSSYSIVNLSNKNVSNMLQKKKGRDSIRMFVISIKESVQQITNRNESSFPC